MLYGGEIFKNHEYRKEFLVVNLVGIEPSQTGLKGLKKV
jgi:hypothetical protein